MNSISDVGSVLLSRVFSEYAPPAFIKVEVDG
jgi:hypothetical protein